MQSNKNNKLTVTFGYGDNTDSAMGLLSAVAAMRIALPDARFVSPVIDGMDTSVLIDQAQLGQMRAILSGTSLKNAFANAENHVGTVQTDSLKNFSVMITAPTALTL